MMDALPFIFMFLMGLSMLIYVVLDGFDLGVGILLRRGTTEQKHTMIASIGPFWDANETWLVLGVGILLVAFPMAHGVILQALYLPVAFMLIGLILRGVAFDFRVKAKAHHRPLWDRAFYAGSLLAALSQGVMLGQYITGFDNGLGAWMFALFIGACLASGYALLGASWLIMKSEDELQRRAVRWAKGSLVLTALGVLGVSLVTPFISSRIFERWFGMPETLYLAPIPLLTLGLFAVIALKLRKLPADNDRWCWVPFASAVGIFVLSFLGLAYSLYPYLVMGEMTYRDAAAAPESLMVIFIGTMISLPAILAYTAFAYRVFWGKTRELSYE